MNEYEKLISFENLEKIYHRIKMNTKHKTKVVKFDMYYMMYLNQIHDILERRIYRHSPYNIFVIAEPKYRVIMSEKLNDKIINHLIADKILKPVIEPKLIPMNVATRENKGSKMGDYYIRKYINKIKLENKEVYALKCDISKYFYSINHEILKKKIRKVVDNEDYLKLIYETIDSTDNLANENIKKEINKKKENKNLTKDQLKQLDELPMYEKGRGLAIGNMTSQMFAIYYLNDLDHYIKEKLKAKYYVRYMDDFIILSTDKEYLKMCLEKINEKVKEHDLKLNKKSCIINMKQGLTFIGYRYILKNNKLIVKLRNQTKKRIIKKLRKLEKSDDKEQFKKVKASYWGYVKKANTNAFIEKYGWFSKKKNL